MRSDWMQPTNINSVIREVIAIDIPGNYIDTYINCIDEQYVTMTVKTSICVRSH